MFKIGTTPNRFQHGILTLSGPHLDSKGNEFSPVLLEPLTLGEAISTEFRDDRHFTCYTVEGVDAWPRIRKGFKDLPLKMQCFAFDWDTPGHSPWTDKLFTEFTDTFYSMTDEALTSWRYMYTSRHGARIVYVLPEPVDVQSGEKYIAALFLKYQEAGLPVDESCKDWTRLFRCPQVERDGIRTEDEEFYILDEQDKYLDLKAVEPVTHKVIPSLRNFNALRHGQLAHDEIDTYLLGPNGKGVSEFVKDAKKEFKNLDAYHALFHPEIPLAEHGNRNDAIMRNLGQAIPITLRKMPYAKPEHIYALFHGPVLTMAQDQDWLAHLWNAIMTIWPVELEKINAGTKEEAKKAYEALTDIGQIAHGMSKWCDHEKLKDPLERDDYVRRHCIASLNKLFFMIDKSGSYGPFPVGKDQLISRIRTTYLNNIVPTRDWGSQGKMIDVTSQQLQNNYSTPINEAVLVPQLESDGYIDDMDGRNPVLKLPMYRRNPNLVPEYDEDVDTWLVLLFGRHYEQAINWIANSLAFEEGPICALSITAPAGVGKKLLTEGLAECLENPLTATGKDAVSMFNDALSRTPFLNVNEEWPKPGSGGQSNQELFKQLTAGDKLPVNIKFKPGLHITNPVRVILTANNHDIIRTLLDKDMTLHDREAVGQRLLHFDLDGEAARWLEEQGGNAFTGRRGHRWIAGVVDPSDYIVAKHFLWLWSERVMPEGGFTGRFLVDGNCSKESSFITKQISQKDTTATVIEGMLNIVEARGAKKYILDSKTFRLYVTINAILEELKAGDKPMTFGQVNRILRNIAASQEPVVIDFLEYHEINCEYLLSFASATGKDTPELRKIVFNQREANKK